ncbi:MAG: GNAT family N-acetyltransferase [Candidatus Parvarchaeota archaeon]|nr:GNAT family N-acetyltransferase [Candidatus Jingweiarchaeum tengchongense]MCW1298055.1 GNAT family N-acetyltransferase [Candidatus Jingweiarchaeum tengchongense]MCW1300145.1 GNAT family N-acetyltransferase [Candidatus Jingweiarchaeum tengchongense]MCW1310907.1 GNAT family N-acetyltransferase [Candidatus Jingweiarchaeum tengchongense]
MLAYRLQESYIPYETKIKTLEETINTFKSEDEFFERAFLLETQFPPGIAFTNFDGDQPELLNDFKRNRDLTFFAVLEYTKNNASLEIYKEVYDENTNEINVLAGYGMAINTSNISVFKEQDVKGYISSVIVHPIYRQKNIASELLQPILKKFDSMRTSTFLTTWCNSDNRINYCYYPPIKFWMRNGYEPVDIKFASAILDGIREMHAREGIKGRNYILIEKEISSLEKLLNNHLDLPKNMRIAILKEYYEPIGYNENRWDGIIMLRKPK